MFFFVNDDKKTTNTHFPQQDKGFIRSSSSYKQPKSYNSQFEEVRTGFFPNNTHTFGQLKNGLDIRI